MTSTTDDATTAVTTDARNAPADVLTPIPGEHLDRPPRPKPAAVHSLEQRSPWATVVWKAIERFTAARAPLIAGGTAYYAFLAMFSLLAFAYGMVALFSADALADWLTDALREALPGVVGEGGIDPHTLMQVGRSTSAVGLVLMVWSGSAVMVAASGALHHIYGANPDGRNLIARRVHLLGWLAILGPLIILSYTLSTAATGFGGELLDDWGIESTLARVLVILGANVLTFLLDIGIVYLLLSRLGGIRASRRPLLIGAVVGAVIVGLLKALMATIISWSVDKPEYGSFALPIAILVVLWLQSMALYASASLTAGTAETPGVNGVGDGSHDSRRSG